MALSKTVLILGSVLIGMVVIARLLIGKINKEAKRLGASTQNE